MTMSTLIAIRGERLALGSYCVSDSFGGMNALCVLEINAENQIVARVGFDPNDLAAAVDELDARYLAGEAAAHAQTWSVITRECAAFNRHEVTAADYVTSTTTAADSRGFFTSSPAGLGRHVRLRHPHRDGASAQWFRSGRQL